MVAFQHAIISSLEGMPTDVPSVDALICDIEYARNEKRIVHADRVNFHVCSNGLDKFKAISSYLVHMYVDCRSLSCAKQLFNRSSWNERSWAYLVDGYIRLGMPHHVHNIAVSYIPELGVHLNHSASFITFFRGCAKFKCIEQGRMLHMEMVKKNIFEENLAIISALVDMYSKCGHINEARDVFKCSPSKDVVLWTMLMRGFLECGSAKKALDCIDDMWLEGVVPDVVTYVCSLKACGMIEALTKSRDLHAEIVKIGLDSDLFIGNALVAVYAKCGIVEEGHEIFNKLAFHDVISWNALINGYNGKGYFQDAISCLNMMDHEIAVATSITFVGGLKACSGIHDFQKGQELHDKIIKAGFDEKLEVGNALVGMYCACGLILEACNVFDGLSIRDVISWTILSSGYAEHGYAEEALHCFERMHVEGIVPDVPIYVSCLNACASLNSLVKGFELHNRVIIEGIESEEFISNKLMDMYMKCGLFAEAENIFQRMPGRDTVSWNVIISGYVEHGLYEEALDCLEKMYDQGVSPNVFTYIYNLRACRLLEKGQKVHSQVVQEGYEGDTLLGSSIIDMYITFGALLDARKVFDEMPSQDRLSWMALLTGYAQCGFDEEAFQCLQEMQADGAFPDETAWASLIICDLQKGKSENVFLLYAQMQDQGLLPNIATLVGILIACGDVASLRIGRRIHTSVYRMGHISHLMIANALIDMYCRCGIITEGEYIFEALSCRDIVTWNTMITGYARHGESDSLFYMLDRMRMEGMNLDGVTLLNTLTVCAHDGLVNEGQKVFHTVIDSYVSLTSIKHHHCMADLLGRAGQMKEAIEILEKMPFRDDLVTWSTMLSAFNKGGHLELGRETFESALRVEKTHSGLFILMSNILAQNHYLEG